MTTIVYSPEHDTFCAATMLRRIDLIVKSGDIFAACWGGQRFMGLWYTICYSRGKEKIVRMLEAINPYPESF